MCVYRREGYWVSERVYGCCELRAVHVWEFGIWSATQYSYMIVDVPCGAVVVATFADHLVQYEPLLAVEELNVQTNDRPNSIRNLCARARTKNDNLSFENVSLKSNRKTHNGPLHFQFEIERVCQITLCYSCIHRDPISQTKRPKGENPSNKSK